MEGGIPTLITAASFAPLVDFVSDNLIVIVPSGLLIYGMIRGAAMLPGMIGAWTRG